MKHSVIAGLFPAPSRPLSLSPIPPSTFVSFPAHRSFIITRIMVLQAADGVESESLLASLDRDDCLFSESKEAGTDKYQERKRNMIHIPEEIGDFQSLQVSIHVQVHASADTRRRHETHK